MGFQMRELFAVIFLVGCVLVGLWAGTDHGVATLDVVIEDVEPEEEPVPVRSQRFDALYKKNEI